MKTIATVLFYGWSGALLVLGAAGIFTGRWELATIFNVDLALLGQKGTATLLNQYRFLKAVEFGFGLFCFVFTREIFTVRIFNRLFLGIVFLGSIARALSMLVEGMPHWALTGITVLEFATGFAFAAYTRKTLRS